jgi:WD40 repeat protein
MGNVVTIYELPGGRVLSTVHHSAPITTVAFASSGHELVSGSVDGSLMVATDEHAPIEVAMLPGAVDVAALLPGGRVVVADARPRLGVYRVARHATPLAEHALQTRATTLRSSLDGQRLLAIPRTGAVGPALLWRLDEPSESWPLDTHNIPVTSARFVSDDREVLTGGGDGNARLWDAQTGRLRRSYLHGAAYIGDVAFEPTGAFAVTAGGDGTLRFWDVPSGQVIWALRAHQSAIIGVRFDGTSIVTRTLTGEIARWELSNRLLSQELGVTLDGIVRCLPVRFDPETTGLVEQDRRCGT